MSDIEILILIGTSLGAGILMVLSHVYLKIFVDEMNVVASYVYGSLLNLLALVVTFLLTQRFDIIRLFVYFVAIWGCTGLLVAWAYTMDFAGRLVRRRKALKQQMNKGDGKRTG